MNFAIAHSYSAISIVKGLLAENASKLNSLTLDLWHVKLHFMKSREAHLFPFRSGFVSKIRTLGMINR